MVHSRKFLPNFLYAIAPNSIKRTYFWHFSRCGYYSRTSFIGLDTVSQMQMNAKMSIFFKSQPKNLKQKTVALDYREQKVLFYQSRFIYIFQCKNLKKFSITNFGMIFFINLFSLICPNSKSNHKEFGSES